MLAPLVLTLLSFLLPQENFIAEQRKFARVREAISEKEKVIEETLAGGGLRLGDYHVLFVAYKGSDQFDVYAKSKTGTVFQKLASYKICSRSGSLGPKRKRGDMQVPEGFYHINMFNPTSNFHLSLGINYPNTSDKRKTTASDPGGEIFIHGACVTIGCLPMTNERIKEIYVYALHARNNGQTKIPVYIFPFIMTDRNFGLYREKYKDDQNLIDFWSNLKTGHDQFMKEKKALQFTFDAKGNYKFVTREENL